MSEATRLIGKDVQIRITRGGRPLTSITAVKSLVWTINTRVLTEQYLGESRQRKDTIYDDTSVAVVIHPESAEAVDMMVGIANRAISRDPNADQVNITFRVSFPNGEVRRITLPQVEFAPMPLNVGGRDQYVDLTLNGEAEQFTVTQ